MAKKKPPEPVATRKVAKPATKAAPPRAANKKEPPVKTKPAVSKAPPPKAKPVKKKKKVDTAPDTVVRAVAFPIATVHAGGTWQEFCRTMHTLWKSSTRASNCAIQQLALADNIVGWGWTEDRVRRVVGA
jgi:hypothetical protein